MKLTFPIELAPVSFKRSQLYLAPIWGLSDSCFCAVGLDLFPAWSFAKALSRELRTIANIDCSGLPPCVFRPSFLTIEIHSEGIADAPSITRANMIVMTL